jgi:hypothetical protein
MMGVICQKRRTLCGSLSVGTDTVTEISVLLTCDDPSKVGTSVEVSYRVLGAYASSGIAAGLNGKIPVALKPRFMFSTKSLETVSPIFKRTNHFFLQYRFLQNDYCRLFVIVDRFLVLLKEVGILHAKTF